MRRSHASSVGLFVVLTACGGAPPVKEPTEVKVGPGPAAGVAPAPSTSRAPSKEIAARWPFAKEPDVVAYGDLASLGTSELVKAIAPAVLALKDLPEPARACGRAVLATAKEMLVGADEGRFVMVVRVSGEGIKAACVPTLEGAQAISIAGTTSAHRLPGSKGEVVAFQPGFVLLGTPALVEASAAGKASGAPPSISLTPDQMIALVGRVDEVSFRGGLTLSPARFRIEADVTMPSEREASEVEAVVGRGRGKASEGIGAELGVSAAERKLVERLVNAVSVSRAGAKLSVAFDLEERPEDQARDLGATSALAVSGVKRYLTRAKQAEARNVLGQLAKEVVSYWEREELGANGKIASRASKKLFSVPATPKVVPRGTKYVSTREDWKPWDKLKFELTSPQYFQYEIKAAKDGESADIIARGDLNGDGKSSMFVLHVALKRPDDRLVISPSIAETDPDE